MRTNENRVVAAVALCGTILQVSPKVTDYSIRHPPEAQLSSDNPAKIVELCFGVVDENQSPHEEFASCLAFTPRLVEFAAMPLLVVRS